MAGEPPPASFPLHWQKACRFEQSGHWEEAAGSFADAARLKPADAEPFFRMGNCLARLGMHPPALQAFDRALGRDPSHAGARISASVSLRAVGQISTALSLLESPDMADRPEAIGNRAELMMEQGRLDEALSWLRNSECWLRRHPGLHSNLIRAMVYHPSVGASDLFEEARRWDEWHSAGAPPPASSFPHDPDPGRPLRVGFVSTRLCRHNSATHLLNLLRAHDRADWAVTLYHAGTVHDDLTAALQEEADGWREIAVLDDAAAAAQIRADRIDLLVDINEHANNGRLTLFTHKPAPVQLHWYGNATTTGVAAIDFRISDDVAEPSGDADAWSSEKILRLPTGYYGYAPPPGAVAPAPADPARGRVTFGAIHHLAKLNDRVLACWRAILDQVAGSELLLARAVLADPGTRDRLAARLRAAGIDPARVRLCGDAPRISSLAVFHEIDLVLDSFPFNGDATTTDALWMGVPVITLAGERLSARRAASQLQRVDGGAWIARSEPEYVACAVEWARDLRRLDAVRSELPARVRQSTLCNAAPVARAMETAFRQAWVEGFVRRRG